MGSQKVPGMLVLHCNGRGYAYLTTFTVGPLRAHGLAPSILPFLVARAESTLVTLETVVGSRHNFGEGKRSISGFHGGYYE
jgi:hypothetical protein